jgi:3-deoxy-7-phosphoheptulonate synthase
MLVTLSSSDWMPGLKAWLTEQGVASRPVMGGANLLVDAYAGRAVQERLMSHPGVAAVEVTAEIPASVVRLGEARMVGPWGSGELPVIAGPCVVESKELVFETARFLGSEGVRFLRGGSDKTRTRPDAFQGLGLKGAEFLKEAAERYGMLSVSEVTDSEDWEGIAQTVDVLQVGARHMHAPRHLQRLGRMGKPVILKRGLSASPEEWLWAAAYLLDAGASAVWFCERGIRTAHPLKRFTLDLGAVPFIQGMTPFPVLVDPSHAAGSSPYVAPLARAALAAGADGIVVECHPEPAKACSDALQALSFDGMRALLADVRRLQAVMGACGEKAGLTC